MSKIDKLFEGAMKATAPRRGKIKLEDFNDLKARIESFLQSKETNLEALKAFGKSHGLSPMRIRWDLLWAAAPSWSNKVYQYANDDHIDTALRHIVGE